MTNAASAETFVFVGSYNSPLAQANDKVRGLVVYRLDHTSGALTLSSAHPEVADPSYLCLHPKHPWLYAVNEHTEGGASAFTIDKSGGALTAINQRTSNGAIPAHISIDHSGRWVLTANYNNGQVSVLPVQDDGSLGSPTASVQHSGHSVHPQRQQGPHAHYITVDPDNRFVLVADLGLDAVMSYRFDLETGTLAANDPPSLVVQPGAGPRHVVFHPSGRFVYVINELDSTIVACQYDAASGGMQAIQSVSTLPPDFTGESTTAAIRIAPSGRFIYGSNRGHDSIAIFAVDPASGLLSVVDHVSTQGQTPRDFNIDPTGAFLIAANQDSNTLVSFRVDQASGRLTPAGHISEVMAPCCVVFGL